MRTSDGKKWVSRFLGQSFFPVHVIALSSQSFFPVHVIALSK